MKYLKLFENYTLDSNKFPSIEFPIIEKILLESENFLDYIVSEVEKKYIKEFDKIFTEYDKKMCYDLNVEIGDKTY